jgi:hypothetical protein
VYNHYRWEAALEWSLIAVPWPTLSILGDYWVWQGEVEFLWFFEPESGDGAVKNERTNDGTRSREFARAAP